MPVLDREEYIEQAYFFRAFRERVVDGMPAQEVLARIGEELLSTTRLPLAVGFLATEIRTLGLMGPAMMRLAHYFAPFQAYVVSRAEEEVGRFAIEQALLILEREAKYRADGPTTAGLFVYQFEALSRNRLGYGRGLEAMAGDPFYSEDWRDYILRLQSKLGDVDFADLIYVRSAFFVEERRRRDPDYEPKFPTLFGEREGKIARANRGRDPVYLFSALQRQLNYPEVPRPKRPDEAEARIALLEQRVTTLENRIKALETGANPADLDISQGPRQARGHRRHARRLGSAAVSGRATDSGRASNLDGPTIDPGDPRSDPMRTIHFSPLTILLFVPCASPAHGEDPEVRADRHRQRLPRRVSGRGRRRQRRQEARHHRRRRRHVRLVRESLLEEADRHRPEADARHHLQRDGRPRRRRQGRDRDRV